jgi:hypothetical protein
MVTTTAGRAAGPHWPGRCRPSPKISNLRGTRVTARDPEGQAGIWDKLASGVGNQPIRPQLRLLGVAAWGVPIDSDW